MQQPSIDPTSKTDGPDEELLDAQVARPTPKRRTAAERDPDLRRRTTTKISAQWQPESASAPDMKGEIRQ